MLLSGNALAVHDIEVALSGTSLGIDLSSGHPVEHGHRNHMRAINAMRRAGGIAAAVETGVLTSGIMHACHTHGVPYILAGSIRDDGPLPETMMDLVAAQDAYGAALDDVEVVVMLSSMLHSIGVGNMLPSWVKVICVDINPAVVTKLVRSRLDADHRHRHRCRIVPAPARSVKQLTRRVSTMYQDAHRSVDRSRRTSTDPDAGW